jgi:hypothetical protein
VNRNRSKNDHQAVRRAPAASLVPRAIAGASSAAGLTASSYACIPLEFPGAVILNAGEPPIELGGVSAENTEGLSLEGARLMLTNPGQVSVINNVKSVGSVVTLGEQTALQLTGMLGELGGGAWNGPGTLEIPKKAIIRAGNCARWGGKNNTRCVDGTPTPGHEGLQIRNFGTLVGAGISLCRDGAAHPAELDNEGFITDLNSGGFGSASECGEVGTVVNGGSGLINIANLDGAGCNVRVVVASLRNEGEIKIGGCDRPETEQVHRATLELESSFSEAGAIIDNGIVQIDGNYAPVATSELVVGVKQTEPVGSPETDFGAIKVSGNATLAGVLDITTPLNISPVLGQRYEIVEAGEAAGSLSGEYTLGDHCIPTEPGDGYDVNYKSGSKGTVTLEVAKVPGC